MKKKNEIIFGLCAASLIAVPLSVSLNSCNNNTPTDTTTDSKVTNWSFTIGDGTTSNLTSYTGYKNESVNINASVLSATNDSVVGNFYYESDDETIVSVSLYGTMQFLEEGETTITVGCENVSDDAPKTRKITVTVGKARTATGMQSFAGGSYTDKLEILGILEKYAMKNHLTGLTLFENGATVVYSSRITFPTQNGAYVPGYGYGILSDGDLQNNGGKILDSDGNEVDWSNGSSERAKYNEYYHSTFSSSVTSLNYLNDQGSVTADLYSYISTSLYGTQLNEQKNGYVWTGLLAKNHTDLKSEPTYASKLNNNPIPVSVSTGYNSLDTNGYVDNSKITELDPSSNGGMFSNYKIYVKTGSDGLKYSTSSSKMSKFNNREVSLDDYITAYKNLITKKNGYFRGSEMTSLTSSGTLKGALAYYQASGSGYNESVWANVGLKKGKDENGEYLLYSLASPLTPFYAKYSLSSNLTSPIPQDFLDLMKDSSGKTSYYLTGGSNSGYDITDCYLSLGAYVCDKFDTGEGATIIFTKNDNYQAIEPGKYTKIPGVYMSKVDTSTNAELALNIFSNGELDAASLTQKAIAAGNTNFKNGVKKTTTGDSTFKLNINSCDEETWVKLFGIDGTVYKNSKSSYWDVKPWMSNSNFLNGISFSINRNEYASARGTTPSVDYFSDTYQWDPEGNEASSAGLNASYNETSYHKDNVTEMYGADYDTNYGYNKEAAMTAFRTAINEMKNKRQINLPCKATIDIYWMNTGDEKEYGQELKKYIEDACNDVSVSNGQFTLDVVNHDGTSQYTEVYNKMKQGQYDLAFGSISGNTLNPLEFLEVLKSDNSSGFTLNYGNDTSAPSSEIVYKDKVWSFDSLWTASVKGAIIDEYGVVNSNPVKVSETTSKVSGDEVVYTVLVDIVDQGAISLTSEGALLTISYKEKASDTSTTTYSIALDDTTFKISTKGEQRQLEIHVPNEFTTESTANSQETVTKTFSEYQQIEVMINYNIIITTTSGDVPSMSSFSFRIK